MGNVNLGDYIEVELCDGTINARGSDKNRSESFCAKRGQDIWRLSVYIFLQYLEDYKVIT